MRDHGGDLDRARATFGGAADLWVDLSTGINASPYPIGDIAPHAWETLPTADRLTALREAARHAYQTDAAIVPLAGAQAAIQLVPRLRLPGLARVVTPTYNEHAASLRAQGWTVEAVDHPAALAGADLGVVVNPNNPDGRRWPAELLASLAKSVGLLVVDESFADTEDAGLSLAPTLTPDTSGIVVLRSFGKFYGLAGLRLGFALAGRAEAEAIATLAGPWAVNGPAIEVGTRALRDDVWQRATIQRLQADADRLDAMAALTGWRLLGGTPLFRSYFTPDAKAAQTRLAEAQIWSRIFPYSDRLIRLGLPGDVASWARLEAAL